MVPIKVNLEIVNSLKMINAFYILKNEIEFKVNNEYENDSIVVRAKKSVT